VVSHLATFTIPADYRQQLIATQADAQVAFANAAEQRQRLEKQLAHARTLFALDDVTKAECLERREPLQRALDALRTETEREGTLERAAAFLEDLPAAWRAATDAQRNALARLLFSEVRIKDDWVVAVKPQPSFTPFFDLDHQVRHLSGGGDGLRRRTPLSRSGTCRIHVGGTERSSALGRRYVRRRRQIADDVIECIRVDRIRGVSLRDLAARYGVSHETIRQIVRPGEPNAAD
jgi:hypothetical protein